MAQLSGTLLLHGAASAICAAPGSSGAGGTLSGVINTYFASPATASVAAGATSVPLGTVSGAGTSIKAGDLLLIVQMQGAAINSTNTTLYGAGGTTGRGSTAVTAGTYEYVKATGAGVAGGSVPVTATLNSYAAATATATAGRSGYQVVVVPQYSTATTGSPDRQNVGRREWRHPRVRHLRRADGQRDRHRERAGQQGRRVCRHAALHVCLRGRGPHRQRHGQRRHGPPGNAGGGGSDGKPTTNDQNSGGGGGNGGMGWAARAATPGPPTSRSAVSAATPRRSVQHASSPAAVAVPEAATTAAAFSRAAGVAAA